MQQNILYIHGFNSGPGQKAQTLKAAGFKVICPQLTNNVLEDIKTLSQAIEKHNIKAVLGSSLGGFYAMALAGKYQDLQYHFINPAYQPYKTFKGFVNTVVTNYKTQKDFTVSQQFLDDLETISPDFNRIDVSKCNFYIATEDEVLKFDDLFEDLQSKKGPLQIHYEAQKHRCPDISLPIKHIKLQFENS
ncbi:YqiA/YcfP family alpha/beta fold hydrolase [Lacinutrix undariae]